MRIGIVVDEAGPSLGAVLDQTRAAAAAGFDGVWLSQRTSRDALTTLAVAGREVPGIELGTAVVPTYPRHPLALAAQALTVQEAVGGRLVLGVGVSHRAVVEGQYGYSFDRPARHLRGYLSALMPALRGERVSYRDETLTAIGEVQVPTRGAPTVLVGALGPAMLRVAGELADGTITTWATPTAVADHIVPTITKAAGRRTPRVVASVPVCLTAREDRLRAWAAENLAAVADLPSYRAILDRGGAAGPQDAIVLGDEVRVEQQIRRLFDAGATDVVAALLGSREEQTRTAELLTALTGSLTD
ncbi:MULTISPECIES: TIGR03564 family F420-dependent LLM class oxidoreductase [Streptomyces]|uniref:TIGR03564 family F420-dependent LLM class oxidoreductase n=1 Tax=Streptomyces griseoaurantiacus TaxID=68213 RepID=UPI002E2A68A7|nr:TIGR03564 family F420-dependent LLM class oxidoreductase [Streptomyces jietaisiensis]